MLDLRAHLNFLFSMYLENDLSDLDQWITLIHADLFHYKRMQLTDGLYSIYERI